MTSANPGAPPATPRLVLTKTMVLELCHTCNLRCVHCYVPDRSKRRARFLDRNLAERLFDQFQQSGFRYILFTGGEPLLHPDFDSLYSSAWDRGLTISLFTNGLRLDEGRLDLFRRKPPGVVRISLFGGNRESYLAVAGRDAFAPAYDRVLALQDLGVPVRVKLPLLHRNAESLIPLHTDLHARGIPCKIELRIIPRFDGDTEVLLERLTPEEIVAMSLENHPSSLRQFRELSSRPRAPVRTLRDCLERCQPFVVHPEGLLQLCFFLRYWKVNLRKHSLADAITTLAGRILAEGVEEPSAICLRCSRQGFQTS